MTTDARADFEAATRAVVIPFRPRREPMTVVDEEIARGLLAGVSESILTVLGEEGARKALSALSGAALAPSELALVRPLADALGWLLA